MCINRLEPTKHVYISLYKVGLMLTKQSQLIVGDEWICNVCEEGIMIEEWNPLTGKQWFCNKCGNREKRMTQDCFSCAHKNTSFEKTFTMYK